MSYCIYQNFSGKIGDDCYLFTLMLRGKSFLKTVDIGTILINAKTGKILTSVDENIDKHISKEHLDSSIKLCLDMVKNIESTLHS